MNILDCIGNTPLIKLNNLQGNIYAKLEFLNPTFSKKDRIAKHIIQNAYQNNLLKKGQEVVEVSSGNTAIALGVVCIQYGNPLTVFIQSSVSEERIKILRKLNVNLKIIQDENTNFNGQLLDTLKEKALKYAKDNKAFYVNQFENPLNIDAQYLLAKECDDYFKKNNINLTHVCSFAGTGGAFSGLARCFGSRVKKVLIEPQNASAYKNNEIIMNPHIIQGGGYGKNNLTLINKNDIDDIITVSDKQVSETLDLLIKKEGILGSYSSAANLYGALEISKKDPNACILITICDTYLKYLSFN